MRAKRHSTHHMIIARKATAGATASELPDHLSAIRSNTGRLPALGQ